MKIIILFCMTFVTVWSRPGYGDSPYYRKSYILTQDIRNTPKNYDHQLYYSPEYVNRYKRHFRTDDIFKQDDRKGVVIIPRDYDENLNTFETKEDPYQIDLIYINGKSSEETDDFLDENEKEESFFVPEKLDDKFLDKKYLTFINGKLSKETDDFLDENQKEESNFVPEKFDDKLLDQKDLIFINGKLSEDTDDFSDENEKEESVFVPEKFDDKFLNKRDLIFINGKLSEETDDFSDENEKEESVFVPKNFDDKLLYPTDESLEQNDKDDNVFTEENYNGELNNDEYNSSEDVDVATRVDCDEDKDSRAEIDDVLLVTYNCHIVVKKRLYETGKQRAKESKKIVDKLGNYISNLYKVAW